MYQFRHYEELNCEIFCKGMDTTVDLRQLTTLLDSKQIEL